MGCANTKTGGATGCGSAEDCIPEGGDTTAQKEVPKVMVDGDEMAANGNVVNANGVEEGTTVEGKEPACNGDLTENKRTSKAASDVIEDDRKSGGVTTPSGDAKSHEMNGGDAVMAADTQDGEGETETVASGSKDEDDDKADQGKDESKDADESSPTDEAADSRENVQGGDE